MTKETGTKDTGDLALEQLADYKAQMNGNIRRMWEALEDVKEAIHTNHTAQTKALADSRIENKEEHTYVYLYGNSN